MKINTNGSKVEPLLRLTDSFIQAKRESQLFIQLSAHLGQPGFVPSSLHSLLADLAQRRIPHKVAIVDEPSAAVEMKDKLMKDLGDVPVKIYPDYRIQSHFEFSRVFLEEVYSYHSEGRGSV